MLLEGGWVSTFFSGKSWGGVKKNPEISDDLKEPYNMKHLLFRTIHSSRPKHSYQPQRVKLAFKKNQSVTFFKTGGGCHCSHTTQYCQRKRMLGHIFQTNYGSFEAGHFRPLLTDPPPCRGFRNQLVGQKKKKELIPVPWGGDYHCAMACARPSLFRNSVGSG